MKIVKMFFLTVITLASLFPFYMMIVMSTYYNEDLFLKLPLLPSSYFIENLKTVFKSNFLQVYANSLFVSAFAVIFSCLISSLIGFAIAKYDFRLKKALNYFIIITMMVPSQVGIIGYIIEMRILGFGNTLLPLMLVWLAFPFGAFFMTQFIKDTIPKEIMECARIDGCSEPRILAQIAFPLIKSGMSTLAILVFLWSWNSYLLPLVTINNSKWYTVPIFVSNLGIVHRTDFAARMCALALTTVPVLLVFIAGSKNFIKGITAGAIKG
ncbi:MULTISPECIES: carbohydrate ABC transporter permease [Paenibacillus]|uniref:Carbohydrate ABC transporter permease n=1 Tax=Paenibacillus baimaensis TaxID=2982185 RepID=A0ABT2UUB4_9BACL|nr:MULTISPECIES: carbohydrate ABC transporter permease [unclassified Paenibacillus]MCU6797412.1 carbohydrate ABC transporter permease [Paenibacillus sp. WQ 127069]